MAFEPMSTEELKDAILMGRKRPMHFAFNPGPKDTALMLIHRRHPPEKLYRTVKKEGEGKKVLAGSFELKQKVITITAEEAFPNAARRMRKYFRTLGFAFKVDLLDPEGRLLDSDDDASEEIAQSISQMSNVTAQDARRVKLAKRLVALQPAIAKLGNKASKLPDVARVILRLLKAGDLDKADKALRELESALAKLIKAQSAKAEAEEAQEQVQPEANAPEQAAPEEETPAPEAPALSPKKHLAARAKTLQVEVEALTGPLSAKVKKAFIAGAKRLRAGDLDPAEAAFDTVEEALKGIKARAALAAMASVEAAAKPEVAEPQSDGPDEDQAEATDPPAPEPKGDDEEAVDDLSAFRASRKTWVASRNAMKVELSQLIMSIQIMAQRLPALEDAAKKSSALMGFLDELDTRLERALDKIINTPGGPGRDSYKMAARATISAYRETLEGDFFNAVDQNGFTGTRIKKTALSALAEVEDALAA